MNRQFLSLLVISASISTAACGSGETYTVESQPEITQSGLHKSAFDSMIDSTQIKLYTLTNADSMEVCITNYGAHVVSITVPGRDGVKRNVVAGFDSIGAYLDAEGVYPGGMEGRFAGYVRDGKTEIDGKPLTLPVGKSGSYTAGGTSPWRKRVFNAEQTSDTTLTLALTSGSEEDKLPGDVAARIDYTLHYDNSLSVSITAMSDAKTLMDVTQKIYFNLSGRDSGNVNTHKLAIKSEQYLPIDSLGTPLGHTLMCIWTPRDFNKGKSVSAFMALDKEKYKTEDVKGSYWLLARNRDRKIPVATITSPESGITLNISASYPVLYVRTYAGNGKNPQYITVTPQSFPVGPNYHSWDSSILDKDSVYHTNATYRFGIAE